jgi:hypothetical protein
MIMECGRCEDVGGTSDYCNDGSCLCHFCNTE